MNARRTQLVENLGRDLLVALQQNLAGLGIYDIMGGNEPDHLLEGDRHLFYSGAFHLLDGCLGDLPTFLDDEFVIGAANVSSRLRSDELLGFEHLRQAAVVEENRVLLVKVIEQILRGHTQGTQQDGGVKLAPPIDAHEQDVPRIKLEVDPRAAIRNDPGRIQEFSAGVSFPFVVIKEHTWRSVELTDDDSLRAVDHEGAMLGHERESRRSRPPAL